MNNPYINDVTTQKGFTLSAYISSLMSTLGGAFTMDKVAMLIGLLLAFLTFLGNIAYQEFRRQRECRQELKDEKRKQELHAADMQLKAALLKQVEHPNGPHSTITTRACSTE
ncbi:HP1 family phage holin [Shewanella oncorhynchi]|uniref:HP1 family phage holin n=1 Tax=Shewanella oncorhynchi TaxID=2726434 RepID=UPI0039EFC667